MFSINEFRGSHPDFSCHLLSFMILSKIFNKFAFQSLFPKIITNHKS